MARTPSDRSQDLALSATRGLLWSGFSELLSQGAVFVTIALLARRLSPHDFGVVTMALIVTGLANLVNELGLGPAIVQRRQIDETHLSTALWANVVSGFALCAVTVLIAPIIGLAFRNELLPTVVSVLSLDFIITSFGTVHRAILTRRLNFRLMAFSDIGGAMAFGLVSTPLALLGVGIWSLVFGMLSRRVVQTALLWFLYPWRPARMFAIAAFTDLFGFGASIMGTNLVNYISSKMDYVVIGRLLGASALGFYSLAYQVISFPQIRLASIVTRVAFPTFSLVQDDPSRVRQAYLKTVTYVSLAIFPIIGLVFVTAPTFVQVVYGHGWEPAVLPLRVLCVAGAIYSVGTIMGSVFRGLGRADLELKLNVAKLLALTSLILIGVRFGITGVAAAVSTYATVFLFVYQYSVNRLTGSTFRDYLGSLSPACLGACVMILGLTLYNAMDGLLTNLPPVVFLATSLALGFLIYIATLKLLGVKAFEELTSLVARAMA